jgi:hypothetical protein
MHGKGAPDDFLCAGGTRTCGVSGNSSSGSRRSSSGRRLVGCDERGAGIGACDGRRDAPSSSPGKEHRVGIRTGVGELAHLVRRAGVHVQAIYVDAAGLSILIWPLGLILVPVVSPMPMSMSVLMLMGASATPSKPTRFLPFFIATLKLGIGISIGPGGGERALGADVVGEAGPLAEGGDEEESGEEGVVEVEGGDGAGLVAVVVRGEEGAVDGEVEGGGQGVRGELGEERSDACCA